MFLSKRNGIYYVFYNNSRGKRTWIFWPSLNLNLMHSNFRLVFISISYKQEILRQVQDGVLLRLWRWSSFDKSTADKCWWIKIILVRSEPLPSSIRYSLQQSSNGSLFLFHRDEVICIMKICLKKRVFDYNCNSILYLLL